MRHPLTAVVLLPLMLLASACGRDAGVPSSEDNRAMDAAAGRLDNAANALDSVDERLPPANDMGQSAPNP